MTNDEFQKQIKKGDVFVTTEDSYRFRPGIKYKFVGFIYCKSILDCKGGCKGLVQYDQPDRTWRGSDCMREYLNNDPKGPLVIMVDILLSVNWLEDGDFLI